MSAMDRARGELEALVSPIGQELLDRLAHVGITPETELRVGALLRREYSAELVRAALDQYELRRRAQAKFTRAQRMYFTRAGLEQATSEIIARHRAMRFEGVSHLADLCCGIGGDLLALADRRDVLAVDRDPLHLRMATLNADAYEVAGAVTAVHADVRDVDLNGIDAVFIDPARRAQGHRMRAGDSEPPLSWSTSVADRIEAVGIKAAPGIVHDEVPAGWEVEFIADRRDLKEAALWSPALAAGTSRATILPEGHVLLPLPGDEVEHRDPGTFLLDPNPAVTRAGLVEDLARSLGAWKIDPRIAFLSSNEPLQTPFARTLRVLDSGPWDQKALTPRLRALDIGSVDIRRRGLAGNVEDLHHQLKLRGTRRATLVMTRVDNRPWALVCVDPDPSHQDHAAPRECLA
ncbi:MAG: class I SAM-dependent methyltransferase [Pseudonocardiales bacterium]|nr:class I SAM-dependent methyltransferase [Pseudonocardiales bacterium]